MKVFLDTNVAIDFLGHRKDFFLEAAEIVDMGARGEVELSVSSLTFVNVAFILRKLLGMEAVFAKMEAFASLCEISAIDEGIIKSSIAHHSKDFEDCVQCLSAIGCEADIVVTRDKTGFSDLPITSMTPTEFLARVHA